MRALPHHFAGDWTKEDVSNLEDTFRVLFDELKRLTLLVAASSSSSTPGPQGPPGLDADFSSSSYSSEWFPTGVIFSGTTPSLGYWVPLTDGDVDETDLIFALGQPIMVFVPI